MMLLMIICACITHFVTEGLTFILFGLMHLLLVRCPVDDIISARASVHVVFLLLN